jgi:hypothetical protein
MALYFLFCNDTIYLLDNGYFLLVRWACSGTAKKMALIAANNYFCAEIKTSVEFFKSRLVKAFFTRNYSCFK